MLAGDLYPASAIGINLPNSNWIRSVHGSKSVTIGNLTIKQRMAMDSVKNLYTVRKNSGCWKRMQILPMICIPTCTNVLDMVPESFCPVSIRMP